MSRRQSIIGILILVIFAFPACASAFSIAKEIQLGKDASVEVEKEMPPSKNQKWQADITAMGQRFMPFVKRKEITYHFTVVKDEKDTINAFALPGGYVYFTEHMWRIMTPDERAAVMAHEITHCDQRHGINQMIRQQQQMLWMLPMIVLSGGGAGGQAAMWGGLAITARYSRKMERQADELGMQLDKAAGFNPAGAVTSMKKLLHIESDVNAYEVSAIFADHPDTQKRIEYLTTEAIALGAKPGDLELPYVDDPSRIGNVTKKSADLTLIYVRTDRILNYGEKVLIKKMLWDDDKQVLAPKTVAVATVLTPGKFAALLISDHKLYSFNDVMEGDGVYPYGG